MIHHQVRALVGAVSIKLTVTGSAVRDPGGGAIHIKNGPDYGDPGKAT